MDRNNGQNKKVTERVYNSSDINRISLGYRDDRPRVERVVSQQPRPQSSRANNVPHRNAVQNRSTTQRSAGGQRRPNTPSTSVQKRRTSSGRRPQKHRKSGEGFWRFMVALIVLIIACIVVYFVVNGSDGIFGGGVSTESKQNETEPKTTETTGETGGETTDDGVTTPEETKKEEEPTPTFSFVADLSEYEMYMNPTGEDRDAYLVLVNTDNPLSSDYIPSDLVDVKSTRKDGRNTQKLRLYAAKALEALMLEADACGIIDTKTPSGYPLSVMSAYRSYAYQNTLFNTYVNQEMQKGISRAEAEAIVVTYSCRAGTSEHQSGLCVDMHTLWSAGQAFAKEDEAKWLAENCYKFGFVLRFPEDKVDITKITYEPWHFRYVGRYHAVKMHEKGMCLEEYTEYLKTAQQ